MTSFFLILIDGMALSPFPPWPEARFIFVKMGNATPTLSGPDDTSLSDRGRGSPCVGHRSPRSSQLLAPLPVLRTTDCLDLHGFCPGVGRLLFLQLSHLFPRHFRQPLALSHLMAPDLTTTCSRSRRSRMASVFLTSLPLR